MKRTIRFLSGIALLLLSIRGEGVPTAWASEAKYDLARSDKQFKVFQFPRDAMPRIDGDTSDWEMVPDSYVYGTDLLNDTEDGHGTEIDREDLNVEMTVGWVKGLNRLYVLYEAYDDFWDFGRLNPRGYLNDIFEIVVDGDMSGGPFIFNPLLVSDRSRDRDSANAIENYTRFSGNHAQNYHIYTPPGKQRMGAGLGRAAVDFGISVFKLLI